jgi:dTDP-glucose 4,6-dehydratase
LDLTDLDYMVSAARSVFESLDGQHVFITGGTGFLGGWLVESLSYARQAMELSTQITVLVQPGCETFHFGQLPGVRLVQGDINSLNWSELNDRLRTLGVTADFDAVIHGAVLVNDGDKPASPLAIWDSVVTGSRNILDVARSSGCERVLLLSSGAVYGSGAAMTSKLAEDCLTGPEFLNPDMAYAEGKRAMESLAAIYLREYGLQSVLARCFSFIGPRLPIDSHLAAAQFVRDAMAGGPIRVRGDGAPVRGYLYAADMAAWLWSLLVNGQPGVAYNVGSEHECSILELATLIGRSAQVQVEIVGTTSRAGIGDYYVPDTSLARRDLGLVEGVTLDDAIERTLSWFSRYRKTL